MSRLDFLLPVYFCPSAEIQSHNEVPPPSRHTIHREEHGLQIYVGPIQTLGPQPGQHLAGQFPVYIRHGVQCACVEGAVSGAASDAGGLGGNIKEAAVLELAQVASAGACCQCRNFLPVRIL